MSLPKVLIIGQPFTNNSGGGITQANLFRGWDKDKIAVVCTIHMFNNLNPDICRNYYILGNEEYKWTFPFNFLQRSVLSGGVIINPVTVNNAGEKVKSRISLRERIVNNYFYPFLEYIGIIHSISKIVLSDKLRNWIREYNPDVIYAQASTRETVLFCTWMHAFIKKPMVFHMMDDWPSTISEKGPFQHFWRNKIDRAFRDLLDKSSALLSISDFMADEYEARYGKKFITFHNPIDLSFWRSHQRKDYLLSNNPTLLYAGRIGPGVQSSLESAAKAMELVNRETGQSIRFVLQTEYKPAWVDKYPSTVHKSLVPYNELPKVFAEADFLLLPYDFSEASVKFIKYSMPTKAPEYMMSGTPVIVYAPEVTALVKDAQKNKWAKIVTVDNPAMLSIALRELVNNEAERRQVSQTAIALSEEKYNAEKVRSRFREVISSLVDVQSRKLNIEYLSTQNLK